MKLLTVSEVAERLRLHEMTVRRHIRSGRLRSVRAGRNIRVREEDVNEFLCPATPERDMSPEELKAWRARELTPEELRRRWEALAEMEKLRGKSKPLGMSTATLVRVARRENEVLYCQKTWEELIAEES